MDVDDSEPRFIISVVDPTNVWGLVSDVLLSRLPFRHVHLKNKFGNLVPISELHVQYLNNDDALLRKRRPHAKQPVTWFRNPYALLVLVSGDSVEEYKQNVRDGLRRLLDPPVDPLGGPVDWIIVYVRPSTIDALSKGPSKVFAALRNDFSTRRRERCMRLDFSGGLVTGVDDLERQLRDAVKSTFEARAAAYDEEVRRLMAMRKAEGWSFSTLFLVKDSLAAMLEAAGCWEDALREYSELEACYSEAIANGGALAAHPFGGDEPGNDQACLLTATWREMRGSVHERGAVPQFRFRQFLFACQARILLKLQRPTEVADRGMKFVAAFGELLAEAQLPPQLREAWSFSACMSLVISLARLAPGASPSTSPSLAATVSDAGHQLSTAAALAERLGRPLQRSASAGNIGDSPERKGRAANGSASPSARSVASTSTAASSEASDGSSLRLDALRAQRPVTLPQRPSRLDPSADRSRLGNAGGGQTNGPGNQQLPLRPSAPPPPKKPRTEWQLGLSLAYDAELLEEAGQVVAAAAAKGASLAPDQASRAFWCALGHLYSAARTEVMRLGHDAGLSPDASDSLLLQNGASPISAPTQRSPTALRHDSYNTSNGSTLSSTPVSGDLAQRLSRFAPFEAAFRARHSRNRSETTDSARSLAPATPQDSFSAFRTEPSVQSASAQSDSVASDSAELPISSGAKGDYMSIAGPIDKKSVRSQSHGDEIGALAEDASVSGSQDSEQADTRSKSETDLAMSKIAGHAPVKGILDPNDPRFVEKEVETGSESSTPRTPTQLRRPGPFDAARDGGGHPGADYEWLTDWRLRAALSDKQELQDLMLELSRCAAMCYRRGGRRRNAALLRMEVAEALAAAGAAREAVSLMAALVQEVLHEGWLSVGAALLLRLLDCSQPLAAADKAPVCLRLLSMAELLGAEERHAVQDELLAAATGLARAAPLPGPLTDLRLPSGHTDALRALWVQPVRGQFGRFFGESASPGTPVIVPSRAQPGEAAGSGGHDAWRGYDGCLGDVTDLEMEVVSSLPAPLDVTNLTVVFSIMQEVTAPLSAFPVSPSGRSPGGSPFEAALDGAVPLSARLRSTPRTYSEAGDLSPRPSMGVMWQEVEEITCSSAANGATVALQPGANRLAFRLHVMKQGLYVLKHAHCRLGRLALRLRAALPDERGPPLNALTVLPPALPATVTDAQYFPGSGPPVGAIDALGNVREAAVVLHALACQPRLRLSAVAYTGALVAGHAYWLGLALEPLHDRLKHLRVHVAPAEATHFADPWAVASSSMAGASWGSRLTGSQRDGSGSAHLTQATCRLEFPDAPAELARIGAPEPDQAAVPALETQRTPLETMVRTSSTGERQESGWISVRPRGGAADLPAWAASQPSLLWLHVQAGDLPTHVQSVRVASQSEHSFGLPRQPMQPGAPMLAADISDCTEVDVNVEYLSGCQRSHAARLAIPVNPPFRLSMMAKELAEKRVMVQTQVTSMLAWQVTITQASMSAPAGYEVQQMGSEILPLQVPPGATVQLLHSLVLKHKVGRLARSSASTLQLHFTLDAAQRAAQPPRQVDCPWERPNLAPDQLPHPPAMTQGAGKEEEKTSPQTPQEHLLSHKFVLEHNDVAETPRSTIAVQLLGPFSVRLGEAAMFCWRLERMASVISGAPEAVSLVAYEAVAEGDAWAPAAPRISYVSLPGQAGAFATVEAAWTPQSAGALPLPQLRLRDVAQKETYDGASPSSVACHA